MKYTSRTAGVKTAKDDWRDNHASSMCIRVIGTSHEENITAKQTKEQSANQCRK
jgi:hypothetical protein